MGITVDKGADGIATVTVDYPPVNAIPSAGWFELGEKILAAGHDPEVHVVILRAEGRGFNAGVDIKEMQDFEGFDHLLLAVARLRSEGMACTLRIVGEGDLWLPLADRAQELGIDGCVELLGARSQAELVQELAWADVLAAPCVVGADGSMTGFSGGLPVKRQLLELEVASIIGNVDSDTHPPQA